MTHRCETFKERLRAGKNWIRIHGHGAAKKKG